MIYEDGVLKRFIFTMRRDICLDHIEPHPCLTNAGRQDYANVYWNLFPTMTSASFLTKSPMLGGISVEPAPDTRIAVNGHSPNKSLVIARTVQ